ncbi:hypothetical protein O181_018579 [Austropuccinia psidii MF-1]|uniref:Uncharacterized protein n=1 Tax=Austropuccinia psidii MF-1 TaxID=1389203 RepID=A0A9Q3C7Y1_9BASI|nr:hypothetical protein [Austropuccinia psidii MF-1]
MHIALGVMHNWLEGVLAEHFRHRWGFQDEVQERKQAIKLASQNTKKARNMGQEGVFNRELSVKSQNSVDNNGEDAFELNAGTAGGFFTKQKVQEFRELMQGVTMPTGATRLPLNLGAARHGCLKASQWLSLFTLVIPLIIPRMYITKRSIDMKSSQAKFLQNTGDLIQCTRIVFAKVCREGHAAHFFHAYNRYTLLAREVFNNPNVKPNHHYALHIPEQMKLWGPLMGVAEFSGERMIGLLQKVKTNQKIDEMHVTIMKKSAEGQMLLGGQQSLKNVLDGRKKEKNAGRTKSIEVSNSVYFAMLKMLGDGGVKTAKGYAHGKVQDIYQFSASNDKPVLGVYINPICNLYVQPKYPPGAIGYFLSLFGVFVGSINYNAPVIIEPKKVVSLGAYCLSPNSIVSPADNSIFVCPYNRSLPF